MYSCIRVVLRLTHMISTAKVFPKQASCYLVTPFTKRVDSVVVRVILFEAQQLSYKAIGYPFVIEIGAMVYGVCHFKQLTLAYVNTYPIVKCAVWLILKKTLPKPVIFIVPFDLRVNSKYLL